MRLVKNTDGRPERPPGRAEYDLGFVPGDSVKIKGPSEAGVPDITHAIGILQEIIVGIDYVDYLVAHWVNGERVTCRVSRDELELVKARS